MQRFRLQRGRLDERSLPSAVWFGLLEDDWDRDLVTTRRAVILCLVWREGFLSRDGLIARTEALVGRGCFGRAADAAFRRDVCAIKSVLASAGYSLRYARRPELDGYYIPDRPPLAPEMADQIRAAMAEADRRQIEIMSRLSPAARVHQAGRLSDGLRRIAVRRLRERQPGLSLAAAHREVMHRYDRLGN